MQKKQMFFLKGKASSVSEGGQLIPSVCRREREKRHQLQSLCEKRAGFSDSGQNISSPWHGPSSRRVLAALRFTGDTTLPALLTLPWSQPRRSGPGSWNASSGGEEILLTRALLTDLAKSRPGQRPCLSLFCWEFALRRGRLKWAGKLLAILPPSLEKH